MDLHLEVDFSNAVQGLPTGGYWSSDPGFLVPEPECSSANWCTHANATGLFVDSGNPRYRSWWITYFEQSAYRFMGKEPFSRIYSAWIVVPVLAVFGWATTHNDQILRSAAQAWLRAYWSYATLSAFPVQAKFKFDSPGRVWTGYTMTTAGARSWERDKVDGKPIGSPYHIDGWGMNWMLYRALNGPSSHLANPPAGWDNYHPPIFKKLHQWNGDLSWSGLTDEDRTNLLGLLNNPTDRSKFDYAVNLIKGKRTTGFFKMYRFEDGAATIVDNPSGLSGATAPLYGYTVDNGGNIGVLSVDPGARPGVGWPGAVGAGHSFVDLNARVATATRDSGEKLDQLAFPRMELPKGKLLYEIWFEPGREVVVKSFNGSTVTTPSNPTVPTTPTTPVSTDFFKQVGGNGKTVFNSFNLAPKSVADLGGNLRNLQTLQWELVSKYMNPNTTDMLAKKAWTVLAGIGGINDMLGKALQGDSSKIDEIRKGLRDIANQI